MDEIRNFFWKKIKFLTDIKRQQLADNLFSLSKLLYETGEKLQNEEKILLSKYITKIAKKIDFFSKYLNQNNLQQFLTKIQNLTNDISPIIIIIGALITGSLLSKLLKDKKIISNN